MAFAIGTVGVVAAAALGVGIAAVDRTDQVISGNGTAALPQIPQQQLPGQLPGTGGNGGNGGASPQNSTAGQATPAQQVGVVDIDTVLQYQTAEAAGTGMILTSNGEVLTNNHVINGATSIKVTVVSTGKTYNATVVGTDPSDDVAVLQMQGASGLQTAKTGNSSTVSVGDQVTAVGNAEGAGGTPSAATGTVLATGQTMTATNDNGANPETLTDMIAINADVVSGDSGGPLYAANGSVIGMDTAASTSGSFTGTTTAYAIPINKALSIANQIESGTASSTIHIGLPGFLGVSVMDSANGATITGVAPGTPAEQAGLAAGDVITAVNGKAVTSAQSLTTMVGSTHPGDQVTITWVDQAGQSHTSTVHLIAGPAN